MYKHSDTILVSVHLKKSDPDESMEQRQQESYPVYETINIMTMFENTARIPATDGCQADLKENIAYETHINPVNLQENIAYEASPVDIKENIAYETHLNPVDLKENIAYEAIKEITT